MKDIVSSCGRANTCDIYFVKIYHGRALTFTTTRHTHTHTYVNGETNNNAVVENASAHEKRNEKNIPHRSGPEQINYRIAIYNNLGLKVSARLRATLFTRPLNLTVIPKAYHYIEYYPIHHLLFSSRAETRTAESLSNFHRCKLNPNIDNLLQVLSEIGPIELFSAACRYKLPRIRGISLSRISVSTKTVRASLGFNSRLRNR